MIDLTKASQRLIRNAIGSRTPSTAIFLSVPRRGEDVEIRGSVLRYVSMPGQRPAVDGLDETRRKFWDSLRRKVAAGARIK